MPRILLSLLVLSASCSALAGDGSVRAMCVSGRSVWAVGDGGLILRSDDAGKTWRRVAPGVTGPAADFSGVYFADADNGFVFGGRVLAGHPGGATVGVILQTEDGGRTWRPMRSAGLARLFGGRVAGVRGVVFGLPTRRCPSGVWMTVTSGRLWMPVKTASRGALLGGAFFSASATGGDVNIAYLVGRGHRIVSLRRLAEPPIRPRTIASPDALVAARYVAEETCWAVGENGSVLRSLAGGQTWRPVSLPTPAGTRRLADLEAIASTGPREVFLAGGLTGVIFHTADGGGRFAMLPAPGPGPVHALAVAPDGALIAGGDGGRIWRRAGESWRLVRGRGEVDVLFIAAAGDVSILPAMAAHAAAGVDLALVYAAVPEISGRTTSGGVSGEAFLRSAAASAGAGGAMVLTDFASVAADQAAQALDQQEILKRWSKVLDRPARAEMLRQMAAAIRLYRPKVVALGPQRHQSTGTAGENHLVSILAAEAVELAGEESALPELARIGLKPWRVRRVFTGLDDNDRYLPPWQKRPPPPKRNVAARFVGWRYPEGAGTSLSMLAMRAGWRLPWVGPMDRPAEVTAYGCSEVLPARALFTSGLSPARLSLLPEAPIGDALAGGGKIRGTVLMKRNIAVVAPALVRAAKARPNDPLPADLLHLVFARLLETADLAGARGLRQALIRHSASHPLGRRLEFAATAMWLSREWRQLELTRRLARPGRGTDQLPGGTDLRRLVRRMTAWPLRAWIDDEPGRILLAGALARLRDFESVRKVYKGLAGTETQSQAKAWRDFAEVELAAMRDPTAAVARGNGLVASAATGRVRVDGRLDEEFWRGAARVRLQPAGGASASARLAATASHLAVGIRLAGPLRGWEMTVAIDADRDVWTQLVLACDSTGRRTLRLLTRFAPPATLRPELLPIQARADESGWTIELALPRDLLDLPAERTQLIRMQIRATLQLADAESVLYLAPQGDHRLLPHRYALLALPQIKASPNRPKGLE